MSIELTNQIITIDRTKIYKAITSFNNTKVPDIEQMFTNFRIDVSPEGVVTLPTGDDVTPGPKKLSWVEKKILKQTMLPFIITSVTLNDAFDELVELEPTKGNPFNTINAVRTWIMDNMGTVGITVVSNIDKMLAIRTELAGLISDELILSQLTVLNAVKTAAIDNSGVQ